MYNDKMEEELCEYGIAGCLGTLMDDLPLLTTAHVRPYIIAILLHRGAVRPGEVVASMAPNCRVDDLKVGEWDPLMQDWTEGTRLERLIDEVLGELVSEGMVRYNEESDLWVLSSSNIPTIISWVATLGGRMPQHILFELSKDQLKRLPVID